MSASPTALRANPDQIVRRQKMRSRMNRALALAVGLVVIAILVWAVAAVSGASSSGLKMMALALATALLALSPLVFDQLRPPGRRHTILAILGIIYMLAYALPVFANYLPAGAFAEPGNFTPPEPLRRPDTIIGQWVGLFSLSMLLLAYAVPVGKWIGRSLPAPRRDWSLVECEIIALGMLAVGWTIVSLGILGVIPKALGSGVISTLAAFQIYACVVLTYAFTRYRSSAALLSLIVAAALSSILGGLSGSKTLALEPVALIVLTRMFMAGRVRLRWIVLGVLGLILFYPVSIFYRQVILSGDTLPITAPLSDLSGTVHRVQGFIASQKIEDTLALGSQATASRFDALGVSSVIIRDTPRVSPFQDGRTLVLFFYSFVPRLLWPNKPNINIGQWITDTYGPGPQIKSQTGATIAGDFYLNFGILGVAAGFIMLGLFLRVFHESLLGRSRNAIAVLLSCILAVKLLNMLTGSVAGYAASIIFAIVPFLLVHLAITTARPAVRARSRAQLPEQIQT